MIKARILVVEDDEDIARNVLDLLVSEGYQASWARNGRIALEQLTNVNALPSLILLDLMMPEMDGFQFRAEQEKDPRIATIPVVVMSADRQIESNRLLLGAKAYIRKPVDIEEVLNAVQLYGVQ